MKKGNMFHSSRHLKGAVAAASAAVVLFASVSVIGWWNGSKEGEEKTTEMEGFSGEYVLDDQPEVPAEIPETPAETPAAEISMAEIPEEMQQEETEPPAEEAAANQAATIHLSFTAESTLSWPVQGEVIVEYSPDSTIYFQTLKQYQTSNGIAVRTERDTPVAAASAGVVSEVGFEDEIGSFVKMDLGNGYFLTYGQLKDINVTEGQFVEAGAEFAKINQPTRYYQVEGANLYLEMTTPEGMADPLDYLR